MKTPVHSQQADINILILAAGKALSQHDEGGYPLCLTEVDGTSVLESIVNNARSILNAQFAFTFLKNEAQRFHLEKIVSLLVPSAYCVRVPEQTQGSACTALLAACRLDQDAELLILSANELVNMDLSAAIMEFRQRGLDAGTLTFRSVHPRYSYVVLNKDNLIIETAQRQPISPHATAGVFWFARTSDFVESAKNMIRKDAHVEQNYFVAPTFNELVLKHKKIGVIPLSPDSYIPLKTERQVGHYDGVQRL